MEAKKCFYKKLHDKNKLNVASRWIPETAKVTNVDLHVLESSLVFDVPMEC